jgi:putative modified peptide
MAEMGDEGRWVRVGDVTPAKAEEFVRLLATDDEFRGRVEQDAGAVLREYGVDVAPGLIPASIELPSKERIQAVIDTMEASLFGWSQPHAYVMMILVWPAIPFAASDEEGDAAA